MSDYPMMLYRSGSEFVWDGRGTDTLTVDDAHAHETATGKGWLDAASYAAAEDDDRSLLDCTAKEIEEALPSLDLSELEVLRDSEKAGKTRKGVIAMLDAAIDAKLAA